MYGALQHRASSYLPAINILEFASHLANKQSWFAGTHFNLVEALVFTRPGQVDFSIINGNFIVKEGEMLTVDIPVRAIANSS